MNQSIIGGYWPLYEDGTPVRIGDTVQGTFAPMRVESVEMYADTTNVCGARDHLHLSPDERLGRVGGPMKKVPCLCRFGDEGVDTRYVHERQGWHVVIDGVRYGVSYQARSIIAESLDLCAPKYRLPSGVAWPEVDGKPVVPGDVLWDELGIRQEVMDVMFSTGFMSGSVDMADGGVWVSMDGLTRTEPEPVLDRDGVPIEVGDTVYKADGSAYTVELVLHGKGFKVRTRSEFGNVCDIRNEDLTHQRPDSWEQLTEDARKNAYDYWSCRGIACDHCPALVDGKTPCQRYDTGECESAVAADIVARAKALAGVVGDE